MMIIWTRFGVSNLWVAKVSLGTALLNMKQSAKDCSSAEGVPERSEGMKRG